MSGPRGLSCDSGEGRLVRHGPDLGPCPNGITFNKKKRFYKKEEVQRLVFLYSQLRP
jgi:hypothetical protein